MEGLKRQREEEARVAGQVFAKKTRKMRAGFIKTQTGVSRDNKTISRATSADRSIVSRNASTLFSRVFL